MLTSYVRDAGAHARFEPVREAVRGESLGRSMCLVSLVGLPGLEPGTRPMSARVALERGRTESAAALEAFKAEAATRERAVQEGAAANFG